MRSIGVIFFCSCLFSGPHSIAQIRQPVNWHFSAIPLNSKEAQLVFTANLEDGWHIYSQHLKEGGPMPTTFTLEPNKDYMLIRNVTEESTPVRSFDNTFLMNIVWFEKIAVFTQRVKLNVAATTINGRVEFMICRDELCLPPDDVRFSLEVRAADVSRSELK